MTSSGRQHSDMDLDTIERGVPAFPPGGEVLEAKNLAGAERIRLEATNLRSRVVADSFTSTDLTQLKQFVRRNRGCLFSLRVNGPIEDLQAAVDQLGEPGYTQDFSTPTRLRLFGTGGRSFRQAYLMASGRISAWLGITVRFSRDPNGSATIRDAFVIFVQGLPRPGSQATASTAKARTSLEANLRKEG